MQFEERCQRLVNNEVHYCLSSLAEECFTKGIFEYEDIENAFYYRLDLSDGEQYVSYDELPDLIVEYSNRKDDLEFEIEDHKSNIATAEEEMQEWIDKLESLKEGRDACMENTEAWDEFVRDIAEADREIAEYENIIAEYESEMAGPIADLANVEDDLYLMEHAEEEPQEIFEWWIVSDWMANHLSSKGCPILRSDYITLWGRTTTGQAIYMDGVIQQIVRGLE
jgi:uncharacterized UPF0160 family protein